MQVFQFPIRYVHTALGALEDSIVTILNENVFNSRFKQILKANSAKSIQYIKQTADKPESIQQGGIFPLLSVSFNLRGHDERTSFLWRYGRIGGSYIATYVDPVFDDDDVELYIGNQRFSGQSDINIFTTSHIEVQDMLVALNQYFPIPRYVYAGDTPTLTTYVSFPLTFDIEFTSGDTKTIDLSSLNTTLVRSINQNRASIPFESKVFFRLDSADDGSTTLSGTEAGDYRVNASLSWELELPAFCLIKTLYEPIEGFELTLKEGLTMTHTEPVLKSTTVNNIITDINTSEEYELGDVANMNIIQDDSIDAYEFSIATILTLNSFKKLFKNTSTSIEPSSDLREWASILKSKKIEKLVKAFGWKEIDTKETLDTDDLTQTFDTLATGVGGSAEALCESLFTTLGLPNEYSKSLDMVLEDLEIIHFDVWSLYTDEDNMFNDTNNQSKLVFLVHGKQLSKDKDYKVEYSSSDKDTLITLYNRKGLSLAPLRILSYFLKET